MEKTPQVMMKEFVNNQRFENTADVLQQVMECEIEENLGCEKLNHHRLKAVGSFVG